jgi:hypothetical protein
MAQPYDGDHWGQEVYSSASDDEYEFLVKTPEESVLQESRQQKMVDELSHVTLPSQYWRQPMTAERLPFSIRNPNTLQTSIQVDAFCSGNLTSQKHVVNELDLIREVLFMLMGRDSLIFAMKDNQIVYRPLFSLAHLSDGALRSLMQQFLPHGNRMRQLKQFSQVEVKQNGPALFLTFTQEVCEGVFKKLADLEMEFVQDTPSRPTSLMFLERSVRNLMKPVTFLHHVFQAHHLFEASFLETQITSRFLLDLLYEEIPMQTDHELNNLLVLCFVAVAEPLLSMIGNLLVCGSWVDPGNEFFLEAIDSEKSWTSTSVVVWDRVPKFMKPFAESVHTVYKSFSMVDVKVSFS